MFPPEEAAPCQQERQERVACPCRHGIQVSSLSPMSPSVWMKQNLLFMDRACLSLGAACPSSLPVVLPVTVPSQARQVPCKPHPTQPFSVAHRAPCPVVALLAPWGWHPPLPWPAAVHGSSTTQLCPSSLSPLSSHGSLGSSACCPWGLGTAQGTGAERRSGKGVGRQGSHRPARLRWFPSPAPPAHLLPLCHSSGQTDAPK